MCGLKVLPSCSSRAQGTSQAPEGVSWLHVQVWIVWSVPIPVRDKAGMRYPWHTCESMWLAGWQKATYLLKASLLHPRLTRNAGVYIACCACTADSDQSKSVRVCAIQSLQLTLVWQGGMVIRSDLAARIMTCRRRCIRRHLPAP